jgi:hypothetical protein
MFLVFPWFHARQVALPLVPRVSQLIFQPAAPLPGIRRRHPPARPSIDFPKALQPEPIQFRDHVFWFPSALLVFEKSAR